MGSLAGCPPNWKAVNLVFLKIGYLAGGKEDKEEWLAVMAGLYYCLLEDEKEKKKPETPAELQKWEIRDRKQEWRGRATCLFLPALLMLSAHLPI